LIPANNSGAETAHLARTEYVEVYSALRQLLKPYEDDLAVRTDKPGHCYLETRSAGHGGRRLFFASAKIKKKYVSYYLPVLYMFPELSSTISPGLRKRMQGQSCFNFTELHPENLQELEQMTRASFLALKSKALL
jgi:hypothetical protein